MSHLRRWNLPTTNSYTDTATTWLKNDFASYVIQMSHLRHWNLSASNVLHRCRHYVAKERFWNIRYTDAAPTALESSDYEHATQIPPLRG
ncbi:hypothetical protein J5I95_18340 [Candidatus Poribacteria bacterium]|nr:hypothetical protein [Candidatus Poribacteria bacterium]